MTSTHHRQTIDVTFAVRCDCACHRNPDDPAACSRIGGCWHLHPDSTLPVVHWCGGGTACPLANRRDLQLGPTPATAPALCWRCRTDIDGALVDAPGLYLQLRHGYGDQPTAGSGDKVTRSKGSPMPLSGSRLHLTDRLHRLLTTWADIVITDTGRPTVDRTAQPEPDQIVDAARLLTIYRDDWLATPETDLRQHLVPTPTGSTWTTTRQAGWEAATELLRWKRAVRRNLGLSNLTHRPPEPCPSCDVPGVLERRDGSDHVHCTNCDKSWTLDRYEMFVHAWIGAA